ncbi:MAG: hypothetical protein CL849_06380 [Crocinitomicaceae bacterium]|nr:hypothetical protein [Crocinitomicaceae bacterium]
MFSSLGSPLLFACITLLSLSSSAQWYATPPIAKGPAWSVGNPLVQQDRESVPQARAVSYEHHALRSILESAPDEWNEADRTGSTLSNSTCILTLPLPNEGAALGWKTVAFRVVRSDVLHPDLAARYPQISSYIVQSERNGLVFGRVDIGDQGFHGIIHTVGGTVYIDPWSSNNTDQLMVYTRKEFIASTSKRREGCDVRTMGIGRSGDVDGAMGIDDGMITQRLGPPYGQTRRNYALALACTGEYGQFHGGTVSSVLSAMNTTINRINSIVEPELAIRLNLVSNNDDLIFLNGSTDPYSNTNTSAMLSQNQTTCDNIIGFGQYDIGHVFATGGGGVAYLSSVCSSVKAGGVSGLSAPIGDPFDVDYVGHEMGHQFGCNHTFNNSCSGNRSSADAYEPGSGSTIMSYSGICAPNLQSFSDDVYHVNSLIEGSNYLHSGFGNSCSSQNSSGNSAPSVSVGASGFSIPASTPFELSATGSDPNLGTLLTYSWEQYDLGPTTANGDNNLNNPSGNAPCIRSFPPVTSPIRVVPKLGSLLSNQISFGEHLPDYNRTLTFKCTVRDNNPGCGGVAVATKSFLVDASTGPFEVDYPNNNITRPGNSNLTILWDVAGTDGGNVDCANVDIFLSADGGYTWPYQLAEAVPNDGEHVVLLPAITTTQARIKVKGHNNIFFDISNSNFTLNEIDGCTDPNACNYDDFASTDDGSCEDPITLYADADGDGFGNSAISSTGCESALIGFVSNATDCDDSRSDVYPGAPGTQDGVDNDCSGGPLDPEEEALCPEDLDNDGFVNVNDILLLLGEFGCTVDCTFDLNGIPGVDVADFLLLLGAFGFPCSN